MIIPDKLTDPNNCLLYYGYLISKHLKKYKTLKLITIETYMTKKILNFSYELFFKAIDFLYLLGKIIYNLDKDEMEFLYEIK